MISSRNLNKYQKILNNAYALSKDQKEFLTGIRSAGNFLYGSVGAEFLFENKCSMRDVTIWQEFDYKGTKLWYRIGYGYGQLTIRDPQLQNDKTWSYRLERDIIDPIYNSTDLKANLHPRKISFFAQIHGVRQEWTLDLAECILLGVEPCLQKVEQPNSK